MVSEHAAGRQHYGVKIISAHMRGLEWVFHRGEANRDGGRTIDLRSRQVTPFPEASQPERGQLMSARDRAAVSRNAHAPIHALPIKTQVANSTSARASPSRLDRLLHVADPGN